MVRSVLFFIFISLLCVEIKAQQRQMYTQFMYNKLSMNPAFSGNDRHTCMTLIYRDQWRGFPGAPKATQFSVNLPRVGNHLGFGFNMEHQSIGITQKTTIEGAYGYRFRLAEGELSMGMSISGRQYIQDFRDPRLFAIQGLEPDPAIPADVMTRRVFNTGFGIYYNTNLMFFGASVPRLIRSDLDFDTNNFFSSEVRHLLVMGGGSIAVEKDLRITPHVLVKWAEQSPFSLDLHTSLVFKDKYAGGLTYRTGDGPGDYGESVDLVFTFQVSDRMMIGFAHDITLSKIRVADNGSLEMILNYCFLPKKIKTVMVNPRYF
jgi:type IX secretion system PorP/SprF family membrane protein